MACVLPKLVICASYLRIFTSSLVTQRITYGIIALLVMNAIAQGIPSLLVCRPISNYWSTAPKMYRINFNAFRTWICPPHVVSDLTIAILPLPVLGRIQMRMARKIGVMITFSAASM